MSKAKRQAKTKSVILLDINVMFHTWSSTSGARLGI